VATEDERQGTGNLALNNMRFSEKVSRPYVGRRIGKNGGLRGRKRRQQEKQENCLGRPRNHEGRSVSIKSTAGQTV